MRRACRRGRVGSPESPVCPRLPSGFVRAARHRQGTALPRQLRLYGDGCMEGSSFFVGTIATGRPTPGYEAPRGASSQGGCSPQGDAVGATAALLRKPLHGAAFVAVTGRGPHRCPQGRRAARSPQAPECGGAPSDSLRRSYGVLPSCSMEQEGPPRSMRWCQRRLRPGRLGPGSGRSLSRCAPSSEGGRDF